MAQFIIEVPDEWVEPIAEAFSAQFDYPQDIPNPDYNPEEGADESNPQSIPNPMSRIEFARQRVIDYVKGVVVGYQSSKAELEARQAAANHVVKNLNIQ